MRLPRPSTSATGATLRQFCTTACSAAPYVATRLPSRSTLSVAGSDARKLLQGLITNDVHRVDEARALFAAVLKADGRLLGDIFVYPSQDGLVIDHDAALSDFLLKYFKRHVLRAKVKLSVSGQPVWAAWRSNEPFTADEVLEAEEWLGKAGAGEDTRAPGMGWRWTIANDASPPPGLFTSVTHFHHQLHRLCSAVPEGPEDWPQLPLEGNIDYMSGVDFKKGCYVGQELTARTHHRGVVRKRGVALRLFREGEPVPETLLPTAGSLTPVPGLFPLPPSQTALTPMRTQVARPRPAGKIGSSMPAITQLGAAAPIAFASVRLDYLRLFDDMDDDPFTGVFAVGAPEGSPSGQATVDGDDFEGGRWLAKAFVPDWVLHKLQLEASHEQ